MRNKARTGFLLIFLTALATTGCKQESFEFSYASSHNPSGTVALGSGQTQYTQNREIELLLTTSDAYEMAFFINQNCTYKSATNWETFASSKRIELPNEDGIYNISVIYRTKDHFPSECQTAKVVLDRQGPSVAELKLVDRASSTLSTPSFNYSAAFDRYSDIAKYQVRVLLKSNMNSVLDWTDVPSTPGMDTALTVALASGSAYLLELRALDTTGNIGPSIQSQVFYAGLQMGLTYLDDVTDTIINCAVTACSLASGVYRMNFNLNFPIQEDLTIEYSTEDFTGLAGLDYYEAKGTLQIPQGASSASFLLNVRNSFQPGPRRKFRIGAKSALLSSAQKVDVGLKVFDVLESPAPATVRPKFTEIRGDYNQTCALSEDGQLYCWGGKIFSPSFPAGLDTYQAYKLDTGSDEIVDFDLIPSWQGPTICYLTALGDVKCLGRVSKLGVADQTYLTPVAIPDFTGIKQIALSPLGTLCGIHLNGNLRCRGSNNYGELGIGSSAAETESHLVPGFSNPLSDPKVLKVVNTDAGFCVLSENKEVFCWGYNGYGVVGQGYLGTNESSPLKVSSLSNVKDIWSTAVRICAVTFSDQVFCWGSNSGKAIDDSADTAKATPVEISGISHVKKVGGGNLNLCFITEAPGDISRAFCQGGKEPWTQHWLPENRASLREVTMVPEPITSLILGANSACALTPAKDVFCWGMASTAVYGSGLPAFDSTQYPGYLPTNSIFETQVKDITLRNFTRCETDLQDITKCYGRNTILFPQMTIGGIYSSSPEKLNASGKVRGLAFSATTEVSCLIEMDKSVWCRGVNSRGQLGDTTGVTSAAFKKINGLANVKQIAIGSLHVCALTEDDEVYCWGDSSTGQVGFVSASPHILAVPTKVNIPAGRVRKLVSYYYNNCVLMEDEDIYCWGHGGASGGVGTSASVYAQTTPVKINSTQKFKDLDASFGSACAVTTGGAMLCWGSNQNGQLGDGTTTHRVNPVLVNMPAGVTVTQGAVNGFGACALTSTGEVYCWGYNGTQTLGTGPSVTNSTAPVRSVMNLQGGVSKIQLGHMLNTSAAGYWHVCALIKIGESHQDVKCWGTAVAVNRGTPHNQQAPRMIRVDSRSL